MPPLFWWEGPDGSRVLCNYTASYGSGLGPPAGWPAKNYLAMIMEGDNHGPPTPKEIDDLLLQAERGLKGVRVHFGTLDDFVHAIEAEKPDLPVVRGDGTDTWIHGIMSMPQETKIARNVRPLEPALDALDTHLRAWGLAPGPLAQPLAAAYENSYLYAEHTWGMNSAYGPCYLFGDAWKKWMAEAAAEKPPADGNYANVPNGSKKKWLKSYDDKREYIRKTERIVNRELQSRVDLLAKSVKADGRRVVVYNPLPWKRSGMVSVAMGHGNAGGVVGLGSGDIEAGDWNGKEYSFFATGVPACGYKTFRFVSAPEVIFRSPKTALSGVTLDTDVYKAVFDLRRGGIASLIEKSTGRELVDQSSPYVLGQFFHERFNEKQATRFYEQYRRYPAGWMLDSVGKPGMPDDAHSPYLATTPGDWKLAVKPTAFADVVTLTAGDTKGLAKSYVLTFTFPRNSDYVDVEWHVVDKTADKLPEGGWLCFPLAAQKPRFTVGRPGAPIDPTKDILPGANRHLMAVATGVAITGPDKAGAAVCPLDSPLVSLDNAGALALFARLRAEKTDRLRQPLQQPVQHELPLVAGWIVERARPHLADRRGRRRGRKPRREFLGGADAAAGGRGRRSRGRTPDLARRADGFSPRCIGDGLRRRSGRQSGHAAPRLGSDRRHRRRPRHLARWNEVHHGPAGEFPRGEDGRGVENPGRQVRLLILGPTPRQASCFFRDARGAPPGAMATLAWPCPVF